MCNAFIGAKRIIIILCRRNQTFPNLFLPLAIPSGVRDQLVDIPCVCIDFQLDWNNETMLRSDNGPRYRRIADLIQGWRTHPVQLLSRTSTPPPLPLGAPAAKTAVPLAPVQTIAQPARPPTPPTLTQTAVQPTRPPTPPVPTQTAVQPARVPTPPPGAASAPAVAQPAQSVTPLPIPRPRVPFNQPAGTVSFELVTDDATIPTKMVNSFLKTRLITRRLAIYHGAQSTTNNLIVFSRRTGAGWDDVITQIDRAVGAWQASSVAVVVVDRDGSGNAAGFPAEVVARTDLQVNATTRPGNDAIWDIKLLQGALDALERWILATTQSAPGAAASAAGPSVPTPSASTGSPAPGAPATTMLAKAAQMASASISAVTSMFTGKPVPAAVAAPAAAKAPMTLAAAVPVAVATKKKKKKKTAVAPAAPAAPAPAPAALAPIAEYDPFDDAYDGGHAMHMHYSALGRALAARLSAE